MIENICSSDSGSIDDTSISTTFVDDSGISRGDVVKYQVRGQNFS